MNPKQLKKLKKQVKQAHRVVKKASYIEQLEHYAKLFDQVPPVKYLINLVLANDHLIKQGLLPQPVPQMMLPDDIQDTIFQLVNAQYAPGDPAGDRLWDQYTTALPKVDKLLREYRDYLETTYGMWSYPNTKCISELSHYLHGAPVLEIMAGSGYLSKGLRSLNPTQTIIATDDLSWAQVNTTGKQPVTTIENYDALAAINQFANQVEYVIMSWAPDRETTDLAVLNLLRQSYPTLKFLVIGEYQGATNSQAFWQTAKLSQPAALQPVNAALHSFDLIDEQIYVAE
ncbi:MAG: SAM-dependent methyltransferase [Limosilactobacillus sp.]|nr:SAM-dependent methyltransferase [Limosilactobacillus sp.]